MKSCFLLFLALAQFIQFVYSSPLGPPGAEDPGSPYAVPQHTTQGFIKRHLKNVYNYFFNKEDSVHQDGYTKVYVMGKHMYYTYTHEYTPEDGNHPYDRENRGNVGNDDDILKYMKDDELIKRRDEEVEFHKQNKKKLEEESIRQMKEGWTPGREPIPPELQAKSAELPPEEDKEDSKEGGIIKKILRKVEHGFFKMAIPTIFKRSRRDLSENKDTSPSNGIKEKLKAHLKPIIITLMGKPHSKITDNVKEEIKGVVSKIPGVLGKAATHVKDAIGTVAGKVVDGVKSAVVTVGTNVIPANVQKMPWREYRDKITGKLMEYARKVDFLDVLPNPDDPNCSYNKWIQMKEHWGHRKKKE
uniref:Uncharacterized protein n=1 Tax=Cacopsylla melanoneura TaxID=428564 RepID=A0A8D9BQG7_9HEMI